MSIFDSDVFKAFDEIVTASRVCRLCALGFVKNAPTVVTPVGKVHAHCNLSEAKWRKYFEKKGASK